MRLAIGDVTGDGVDDIVTATASGTGRIRIFDGVTHQQVALGGKMEIAAFTGRYQRGAYVALGDVDGDGKAEIISAQGTHGGKVNVDFSGTQPDLNFTAGGRLIQGVYVTAADTTGDGVAEIIIGRGRLGTRANASIGVFQVSNALAAPTAAEINTIALNNKTYLFSTRVAAADLDGDGKAEIFAAPNYHGKSTVEIFDGATSRMKIPFTAFPAAPELGVFVAASVPGH